MDGGLPLVNYLLQHTLRSLCTDSQWLYAVFWRILPRNYPPPKWDTEGGIMDRSRGNKRNWILVWEDGYCDFSSCARAAVQGESSSNGEAPSAEKPICEPFQPELFFKMSHEIYNYGEGLMGKVASDNSHKWVHREPSETDISFLSSWHGSIDPHPRTWEAQFKSGIQTIAVVAVREGLIQLGSLRKIAEDLNFVIYLQRKFNYLQSIPGVFAMHPAMQMDLRRSRCLVQETPPAAAAGGGGGGGGQSSHEQDHHHHHQYQLQFQWQQAPNSTKRLSSSSSSSSAPPVLPMDPIPTWAGNNNASMMMQPPPQPSMSSLQALLSKLPSVTSADTTPAQPHHMNIAMNLQRASCGSRLHQNHQQQQQQQQPSHSTNPSASALHISSLNLNTVCSSSSSDSPRLPMIPQHTSAAASSDCNSNNHPHANFMNSAHYQNPNPASGPNPNVLHLAKAYALAPSSQSQP